MEINVEDATDVIKHLLGSWMMSMTLPDGSTSEAILSYLPEGIYNGFTSYLLPDGSSFLVTYSGTWEYRNQHLFYKINSSTIPELVPVGMDMVDKLIRLSSNELVVIDGMLSITQVFIRS